MKARVKATGEIVEVEPCKPLRINGFLWPSYEDEYGRKYPYNALEENTQSQDDPDYWTRLEHQYAGMAMQGILACEEWKISPRGGVSFAGEVALQAQEIAHALVEKMKEERK